MKKDLPSHSPRLPISENNTRISLRSSSCESVLGHCLSYSPHPDQRRKRRIPNLADDGEGKGKGKQRHRDAIPVQVAALHRMADPGPQSDQ